MTAWLWILGGVYLLLLVYATVLARRRTRNSHDYVMAGSSVGAVLGFLTFGATLFSTFTLMGMPDFFRTHGVGAWIFLGVSDAALAFFVLWFGFHLRRRAAPRGFKGVAGFVGDCCSSRWGGYLYFAAVFVFMIPYVAIQIRGVGIFLNAAFPETLPVWGWATVIVAALLIYSAIGGLKAIIFSDALQGSLLLGATWIAAIVCVRHFGGVAELFRAVRETNAALLSTPGPQGLFTPQFLLATFLVLLMLPVTQPQLTTRIVIMRDTRASHRMAVGVGVFSMLVILPTIAIGMYGAARYPDLSTADFLARVLLFDRAPVVGAAIAVGLIAAAMSTADSQIFALGTELRSLLSGEERAVLLRTKLAIVGFAAAALVFAIVSSDQLVLLARVSFAGTALLGPLILVAVLAPGPVGTELLVATIAALLVFLTHLADWIPDRIGPLRLDLLLLLALGTFAALSVGLRGHLGGRRSSS